MSDYYETTGTVEQSEEKEWLNNTEPEAPSTPWAWRIAGILLIVLLILRVLLLLWSGPDSEELLGNWRLLFDLVLGIGLIAGAAWARTWALWRAAIYVGFSLLSIFQDVDYLDIILQISVGISLFLLLWETPGKLRILGGVLIFIVGVFGVLVFAVGSTILASFDEWDTIEVLIGEEQYMEAETLIQQILAENPEDDMAYNYLGIVYSNQDYSEKAIEYFSEAIELDPNYYVYYYNRADEWIYIENFDAAIADIQKVDELTNNGYEVDTLYTSLYLVQSEFPKARDALKRAEQKGAPEEEIIMLRIFINLWEEAENGESDTESPEDGT